ncbi:MAG: 30S ribosomal protein S13 [Planctomycetes bacterium]|nr:30S ribosomal protein S13 [Planctomycetota bacterium]
MPRIVGVDIPGNKRLVIALTYIHGIGNTSAKKICKNLQLDESTHAKDLPDEELVRLGAFVEKNYTIEGQLRRQIGQNIQRLKEINSYRGLRHRRGLPVRGQQTQSNARTRKGPKKTVAGKKSIKRM